MSRLNTPIIRFLTNTSTLIFADGTALVTSAVFIILLGRTYGAAELGLLSYAMAFAAFIQTIIDSGYDITLPRSISANPLNADVSILNSISTKAMMWILIVPLAVVTTFFIRYESFFLTLVMFVDIIPTLLGYTYLTALRGLHITKESSVIQGIYTSGIFLTCALLVLVKVPLIIFTLVMVLGDTCKYFHLKKLIQSNLATSVSLSKAYKLNHQDIFWNTDLLFRTLSLQKSLLITNILSSALVRIPTIFLGWFSQPVAIGEFAAASRFYTSLRIIPGGFFNAILPEYSNTELHSPKIKRVLLLSLVSALGISGLLYFTSPNLINFTFKYQNSVTILQILSIGYSGLFLKTIVEAFLLAKHLERLVNITLLVVSIFAISAMMFYAGRSSIALAWCVTISEWVLCLVMTIILILTRGTNRFTQHTSDI